MRCGRRAFFVSINLITRVMRNPKGGKSLWHFSTVQSAGMKQLMAGGGVALIGVVLVPLLSGLFG